MYQINIPFFAVKSIWSWNFVPVDPNQSNLYKAYKGDGVIYEIG